MRKTYSDIEKALLLEAYKSSTTERKQCCKENAIDLSILERRLKQEKKQTQSQPRQDWIPLGAIIPESFVGLKVNMSSKKYKLF